MAHSNTRVDLVLVYDGKDNFAAWVMPSTAWRMQAVYPCLDIIDPGHPGYEDIVALAGPKPEIYILTDEEVITNAKSNEDD